MSLIPSFSLIFLSCLSLNLIIILTKKYHGFLTNDNNHGPQKIHISLIPRVGGISIFITLIISIFVFEFFETEGKEFFKNNLFVLILISMPIFFVGLLEDLLKDISIFLRLFTSICVGTIAIFLFEILLPSSNISSLDNYIDFFPVLVFFTLLFFSGLVNAINLVDGINGLATFVAIIALLSISRITISIGDLNNYFFTLIIIANLCGFFFINWFFGSIFLGDSGAYLLGVILAFITSKILIDNNLSILNILTLFAYPIWEISYSIFRRLFNGTNIMKPDSGHLHSLMYVFVKNKFYLNPMYVLNFLPTLFLLPIIILGPISTIFIFEKPRLLAISFLCIYIFYIIFYKVMDKKIKSMLT